MPVFAFFAVKSPVTSASSSLPVDGVLVVAVEQAVAAPFASRQLADLGARVIKIERPGVGDFARWYDTTVKGMASHFVWTNRSKESLTLDLKRAEAAEVLRRLIARADVFIHNLAPGAVEPSRVSAPRGCARSIRGSSPADIRVRHRSGPYRDKKAYDLLVQSEAGTGVDYRHGRDAVEGRASPIADIAAGMYAFSGVLAALLRRERTGEGAAVEVSMFDALAEWMGFPAYYTEYGGSAPPRSGARHASIAPYGPFIAGDGHAVYLGLQNEREWVGSATRCCSARSCQRTSGSRRTRPASRTRTSSIEVITAGVFRPVGGRGRRAARRRRHRQRPHEHDARVSRSSAACRTGPVARG